VTPSSHVIAIENLRGFTIERPLGRGARQPQRRTSITMRSPMLSQPRTAPV
jgi:hypothetical protein